MELIYKSRIEAIAKRETNYNPIIENRIVDEARQNGPSFHRDGQVIRPAFVDGGQEWSSTVCYILKYGLTFFCLPPFPVTPVQKVCCDAPGSNVPIPFADNFPDRAGEGGVLFYFGQKIHFLGYEVHKFPAMPVDKQIHLATRIV